MSCKRALVIEDESPVGLEIESALTDAGFEVVGPIMSVKEALQVARQSSFDIAVLDANLNGQNVGPVADILVERRVPFVVVSGYAREHLPLALANAPFQSKPVNTVRLVALIQRLCRDSVSSNPYSK